MEDKEMSLDEVREYYGMDPQVKKKRSCLTCSLPFNSDHVGNRICYSCSRLEIALAQKKKRLKKGSKK